MENKSVSAQGVVHPVEGGRPAGGDPVDWIRDDGAVYIVNLAAPTPEQAEVLKEFGRMLAGTSRDGGRKRAAGLKPSWKVDLSHEAAIWSHMNKWKHGERVDPESGQHPLVHLAWRALAIAWQETHRANIECAGGHDGLGCGPECREEGR